MPSKKLDDYKGNKASRLVSQGAARELQSLSDGQVGTILLSYGVVAT